MIIGRNIIMEQNDSTKELMERLDKCTALLKDYKRDNLIQAKEIDRLNEYVQILEMEQKK
ncbi:hypothetical protein [uncultured Mediterranean phage uvMED]|nr:hypothetical protein [uncultured Mediterranean phage uvMED]